MDRKPKALEFKVGLFAMTGLLIIAAMTIWFGRLGQGFQRYYPLTVQFPDAGGLVRNTDIRLAGARIGYVSTNPQITPSVDGVVLELRIKQGLKIPKKSRFQIGSSGLLGDRFVQIIPAADFDPTQFDPNNPDDFFGPEAKIIGEKAPGIEELTAKGATVLENLNEEITAIRDLTARVNDGVLSESNIGNLQGTLSSIKKAGDDFAESSAAIRRLVDRAETVIGTIQDTAGTTGKAAEDLRVALTDARKLIGTAHETLKQFEIGKGPVGALLHDKKLADDLKALIYNLRERGVLFYRDIAEREKEKERTRRREP
jgi:ABC-type transporter Mla subunit MlaD